MEVRAKWKRHKGEWKGSEMVQLMAEGSNTRIA